MLNRFIAVPATVKPKEKSPRKARRSKSKSEANYKFKEAKMEKVSDASRAFKCDQGETVTMTFTANNTDLRVTYRFEDEDTAKVVQGNSFDFQVTQPFRILRVFFHF